MSNTRAKTAVAANPDTRPINVPENTDQAIQQAQRGRVSVSPSRAVEMAGSLYSQGKYVQAEKVCRQLLAARPNHPDAHNILGVSLNALGRGEEGLDELRKAIELAPEAASIHANLGEVLRQRGR
jgi:Flp pilus assembly protein TadD